MKNSHSRKALLKIILRTFAYKRIIAGILAFMLLLLVIQLLRPLLLKITIDRFLTDGSLSGLHLMAGFFLLMLVLEFILDYFQTYYTQSVSHRLMADLRKEVFEKIIRNSMSFFDKNQVGSLMSRVTTDISSLQEVFSMGLIDIIVQAGTILVVLGILFLLDARLALIVTLLFPVTGLCFYVFSRYVLDRYRRMRRLTAQMAGFLQENLSGMSIIQIFNQEERHNRQFRKINKDLSDLHQDVIFSFALFFPIVEATSALAIALILWYGGMRVLAATMTIGTLVAFIDYSQRMFAPLKDLSERYNVLQKAVAASERIQAILDDHDHRLPDGSIKLNGFQGRIELRNVGFCYNAGDEYVLNDITLTIEPGEKIAIVGATGSGKSTLLKLLLRLYDVTAGAITLDGYDLRTLAMADLRRHFGYIVQDPFIFSDTIANNIRLFDRSISDETVREAAAFMGASAFINAFPDSFEHRLSEKGANISVGEKQLLALARLAAFNPRIFLLDEATANIDVVTEQLIEENLPRLMQGRTSIVIAHRLSTVKAVDRIIVLHNGTIAEQGSHNDLLQKKGLYYKLYKYQYKWDG